MNWNDPPSDPVTDPLGDPSRRTEFASTATIETVRNPDSSRMAEMNLQLANALSATTQELVRTRDFLVQSLSDLIGARIPFGGSRGPRLQRLCGILCVEASRESVLRDELTPEFVLLLTTWVPLLDVGYLSMHDSFLLKPGKLTPDEREKMQEHTILGADLLARIASRQPQQMGFYHMPIAIARYHHERYDGTGYPDRLIGMEIPLAARITSICDVYDALRSQRVYKPRMNHQQAVRTMVSDLGHFDPNLMEAFRRCAGKFDKLYLGGE